MGYTSEWSTWQTKRPSGYPEQGFLIREVEGEIYLKGMPNVSRYKNQSFPVSVRCYEDLYVTSILLILRRFCLSVWAELMWFLKPGILMGVPEKTAKPCKPLRANYFWLLQSVLLQLQENSCIITASCIIPLLIITASSCYIGGVINFRVWFLPLKA